MNKTKIEWADYTWSPVTGCLHGCEYCYARKIANRFAGYWNEELLRHLGGDGGMHVVEKPMYKHTTGKNRDIPVHNIQAPYPYDFDPTFHKYRLDEPARKTKGQNIFVCSMADLFGDWVPDEWIQEVFEACRKAPQHNYLFLTKKPVHYLILADKGVLPKDNNYWWGTTITNQAEYDNMGTILFNFNKKYRTFFSIEPIHENIEMGLMPDWIIVGAETGNTKGKIIPKKEWIESMTWQCVDEKVFMKDSLIPIMGEENMLREFPEGLRGNKCKQR